MSEFRKLESCDLVMPSSQEKIAISDGQKKSAYHFDLYEHSSTGLQVIFIESPGPASSSTIVVPTLCDNDYGLPHTLEHLVFCGSKNYPTRGYLEALATRSLSTGTNAWTAPDHTAYTLSTVGYEGLLNTVPVFLDHVVNPILAERDFTTEVYHIDGSARQQGVVFSEMVSRENSECDLLERNINRILYQDSTTYSYECGGLTPYIAKLDNNMIKEYHQHFYRLGNICIILAGQDLPIDLLLESIASSPTLKDAEELARPPLPKIVFPPVIELLETKVVHFPSEDESSGSVGYAWRGPLFEDFTTRLSLELLLFCLTDSPASPLNQACVAPELPLANNVSYSLRLTPEASLWLQFSGVPKGVPKGSPEGDTRGLLEPGVFRSEFLNALTKSINDLNYELIQDGISRYRIMLLESLEDNAFEDLAQSLIPAIVADRFSSTPLRDSLHHLCIQFTELQELALRPLAYWQNLAYHWLLRLAPAEVVAVPDKTLSNKLEAARANAQSKLALKLGQEELDTIQQSLDSIILESKIVLGQDVEASLPQPPELSHIPTLPASVNNESLSRGGMFARAQVVEIETQFTRLMFGLPTWNIPEELEPLLVLFQNLLFQLDLDDPELGHVDYREAIKTTDRNTVERFSSIGLGAGEFSAAWLPELFFIGFKSEPSKWKVAQDWIIRNLLFCRFTAERVLSVARNLLTELEEVLRDGGSMLSAFYTRMLKEGQNYDTRLDVAISLFRQEEFLNDLVYDLAHPSKSTKNVLVQLEKLRDILVLGAADSGIMQFGLPPGMYSDTNSPVQEFGNVWASRIASFSVRGPVSGSAPGRSRPGIACRSPYSIPPSLPYHPHLNVSLGSLTSSYIVSLVPCDVFTSGTHLRSSDHIEKMATATLCELLSRSNGPLFELIRGQGLAYHVDMYVQLWSGVLVFELHDSVNPAGALLAFWGFLVQLQDPNTWSETITPLELQLAKSSLVYTSTRYVDCPSAIFTSTLKHSMWGFDSSEAYVDHYRTYLEKVTLDDLRNAFLKYFCQFLEPERTQMVILTPDPRAEGDSSDTEGDDDSILDDDTIDEHSPAVKPLAALADNPYGFNFMDGSMEMF